MKRNRLKLKSIYIIIIFLLPVFTMCGCPEPSPGSNPGNGDQSDSSGEHSFINPEGFPGSIAGTVYLDGRPLPYGTVQAFDSESKLAAQERCTLAGHYTLKDLLPGRYSLICLGASGAPIGKETIVQVRPGRFEQVDLELSSQD